MLMPRKDASAKARSPSIVPPRARKPPTSDLPYVLRHFTLSIRMLVCSTLWARRKEECFDRALEGGNCNDAREDGATLAKRHGPQPTRPSEVAPAVSARAPHSTHLYINHSFDLHDSLWLLHRNSIAIMSRKRTRSSSRGRRQCTFVICREL